MKKVIIFGAGQAGLEAKKKLVDSSYILAFCDNDPQKVGQTIEDIPVISPSSIEGFYMDEIVIASEFFEKIEQQLIEDYAIPKDKISILPASIIKPSNFKNSSQREIAGKLLLDICEKLKSSDIRYYIDAGTLLGIYRDGNLIPWDDDLDVAIDSSQVEQAQEALEDLCHQLEFETHFEWNVIKYYSEQEFGAVKVGNVRSLKLACANSTYPMLDVFVKYVQGDRMDYVLSSRGISMPSCHLLKRDSISFMGKSLFIPSQPTEYLTLHYGDWQTPIKEWNLGMLKNATVF